MVFFVLKVLKVLLLKNQDSGESEGKEVMKLFQFLTFKEIEKEVTVFIPWREPCRLSMTVASLNKLIIFLLFV